MSPNGGGKPKGKIAEELRKYFGSLDKFTGKAITLFGSGWVFLVADEQGKPSCRRHSFQSSPYLYSHTPILGLYVWEHGIT